MDLALTVLVVALATAYVGWRARRVLAPPRGGGGCGCAGGCPSAEAMAAKLKALGRARPR